MSILVVAKIQGDTAKFRSAVVERADEFARMAERARGVGAMHHRFGVGDGVVVVVDEWESTEHFEKFFSDPDVQAFIGSVGADLSVAPDLSLTEVITTSDQF